MSMRLCHRNKRSTSFLNKRITDKLVGEKLDISLSTKQRGQQLERMVAYQLGYSGKQDR